MKRLMASLKLALPWTGLQATRWTNTITRDVNTEQLVISMLHEFYIRPAQDQLKEVQDQLFAMFGEYGLKQKEMQPGILK